MAYSFFFRAFLFAFFFLFIRITRESFSRKEKERKSNEEEKEKRKGIDEIDASILFRVKVVEFRPTDRFIRKSFSERIKTIKRNDEKREKTENKKRKGKIGRVDVNVYVKLPYLRQSPEAVLVFCLGTEELVRSILAETCYYRGMRKRRTGPPWIEETQKKIDVGIGA